jgi:hypothetical protein
MRSGFVVVVALAVGCTKRDPAPAGPPPPAAPAPAALAPADAATSTAAPVAPCKLDGSYRLRFASNGSAGWWLRVEVAGDQATLVEPAPVLGLPAGPLTVAADPARCALTLGATSDAVGTLAIALTLDPKTDAIAGVMTRTAATDAAERSQQVRGVHDIGPPASKVACVVPGIYKVAVAPHGKWANSDAADPRSCAVVDDAALAIRVEPMGAAIAISAVESEPPYAEKWATSEIVRLDDCRYIVKFGDEGLELGATLTFAGAKVTGALTLANRQIVEDGEAGENIWNCVTTSAQLTVVQLRQ